MTSQSETMMGLLKELALLKQLDEKTEANSTSGGRTAESEARQIRREEITGQIKTLGEDGN